MSWNVFWSTHQFWTHNPFSGQSVVITYISFYLPINMKIAAWFQLHRTSIFLNMFIESVTIKARVTHALKASWHCLYPHCRTSGSSIECSTGLIQCSPMPLCSKCLFRSPASNDRSISINDNVLGLRVFVIECPDLCVHNERSLFSTTSVHSE